MEKKKLSLPESKIEQDGVYRVSPLPREMNDRPVQVTVEDSQLRRGQATPLYPVDSSDFPRIQQICFKIDENFKKSVFSIKHPDYKTPFRNFKDAQDRLLPYHLLGFESGQEPAVALFSKFNADAKSTENSASRLENIASIVEPRINPTDNAVHNNLLEIISGRFLLENEKSLVAKLKTELNDLNQKFESSNQYPPRIKFDDTKRSPHLASQQQMAPLNALQQRGPTASSQKMTHSQIRPMFANPYVNPAMYPQYYSPSIARPHPGFIPNNNFGNFRPPLQPPYPYSTPQQMAAFYSNGPQQLRSPFPSESFHRVPPQYQQSNPNTTTGFNLPQNTQNTKQS
jgi:hypothetical protein